MAEDTSSTASNTIPFPTLTILYLPAQAEGHNRRSEPEIFEYNGRGLQRIFSQRGTREYKKVTIWSQGIDSLWFNAIIASIKERASVEFVPIVSGGVMYSV